MFPIYPPQERIRRLTLMLKEAIRKTTKSFKYILLTLLSRQGILMKEAVTKMSSLLSVGLGEP